jgi:hypothetical protein
MVLNQLVLQTDKKTAFEYFSGKNLFTDFANIRNVTPFIFQSGLRFDNNREQAPTDYCP